MRPLRPLSASLDPERRIRTYDARCRPLLRPLDQTIVVELERREAADPDTLRVCPSRERGVPRREHRPADGPHAFRVKLDVVLRRSHGVPDCPDRVGSRCRLLEWIQPELGIL